MNGYDQLVRLLDGMFRRQYAEACAARPEETGSIPSPAKGGTPEREVGAHSDLQRCRSVGAMGR